MTYHSWWYYNYMLNVLGLEVLGTLPNGMTNLSFCVIRLKKVIILDLTFRTFESLIRLFEFPGMRNAVSDIP